MQGAENHNSILVAGRAGNLTDSTNPLTFSLLEKMYGYGGPYRECLKYFGVTPAETKESFLVNNHGRVYSDINRENKIIWANYPVLLQIAGDKVITKLSWFPNTATKLKFSSKKLYKETLLFSNLAKTEKFADTVYKSFSAKTRRVCGQPSLNSQNFLNYYKDVFCISYLYELFLNHNIGGSDKHNEYSEYLHQNDYLTNGSTDLVEQQLKLPKGFYLDNYPDIDKTMNFYLSNYKFIPKSLPTIERNLTAKGLEIKLMCMRNNMKLQTNILLYFLNKTLIEISKQRGLTDVGFLTLDEIETENNTAAQYEQIIIQRKNNFDLS